MANEDRECYVIDVDDFVYGPFRSEHKAAMSLMPGRIEWLEREQINEYGKYAREAN